MLEPWFERLILAPRFIHFIGSATQDPVAIIAIYRKLGQQKGYMFLTRTDVQTSQVASNGANFKCRQLAGGCLADGQNLRKH